MPLPYNPCKDGFYAKVWECLRRNEEFKAEFQRNRDGAAQIENGVRSPDGFLHPIWDRNEFASTIIVSPDGWDLGKNWSELSVRTHCLLYAAFRPRLPFVFKSPPTEEWLAADSNNEQLWSLIRDAKYRERDNVLVAIPKIIRDQKHKKQVVQNLINKVPEPAFDARYLKKGGRTLGTGKQWEAYLLHEYWTGKGLSRIRARAMVAWKMHEPESYRNDEQYLLSPEGRRIAASIDDRRGADPVWTRIEAITDSIASVYPQFKPYLASR